MPKRRSIVTENSEDIFTSQKRKKALSRKNDEEDSNVLRVNSLFGELVSKAGYILQKDNLPNLLSCDQAVFQKDLTYSLKSHPVFRLPEIAEKFVKGLEDHVEDPQRLKWSLLYTQTVNDCETARGGQQDSLIRLCLNIEELQPCLIQLLTEKLLEAANDDEASSDANIPSLILANLKWLDYIVDSDTLTTKIVEIIEGSPLKVQQEVITYVPSIVNDANHPKLAEVFCDLYDTTPELTPAILDTLGHLTLPKESVAEVFHSVLKTLHAARPEQLHVIVKFLLTNTQPSVAYQVLSDIREKINLPGDCRPTRLSPKKSISSSIPSTAKDDPAYETLLLNNIKMAIITNKFLATNWLKAIQDVCNVASVRPIDFLVLLILYDAVPSQRHPIESIFRNKIRTGLFSDAVLGEIFAKHIVALKENFKSLKKISSLLLRSPEPLVSQTAATLYKLSFLHLGGHYRQESMLALLNHLGDSSVVRHTALTLLSTLAHKHTADMSKFTIFIKGSMEMMDELSMREVKRLLDVVILLVFSDNSHAALQDELMILVRKQLCHTNPKYKHIGVLTAALIVKNMVNEEEGDTSSNSTASERSIMNTRALKEAENLLCLVMSSTAHTPTAAALFMDELASISLRENMNHKLEEFVCDKMTNEFQNNFVTEIEPSTTYPKEPFAMAASWNLDAGVEGACIALNLAPLVVKAESSRLEPSDKKTNLVYLTPQFRLLRMLECRIQDGDLVSIDALLGCPVISPAPEVFDNFDSLIVSEQHVALSCLFYTINWFRELLNAFVTQKDREMKDRVYKRLDQVIELENLIAKYLPKCPNYVPPIAVFDVDCSMATPTVSLINTKKAKRGRKPGSGKGKGAKSKGKNANTDATQLGTQACSQPVSQVPLSLASQSHANKDSPEKNAAPEPTLDKASLRPFLRELHFDVFYLLFRKLALHIDVAGEGQLTLPEAEFLLTDLNCKLEHIFGTSNKRASVLGNSQEKSIGHSHLDLFSPAEVAEHIIQILKPLCVHLEKISTFFHTMIADNDGIMDAPTMFTENTRPVIKVNLQLFMALQCLLSWKGLQQEGNKEILLSILRIIAKKLEGDVVSSMDQEELTSAVFRYLSNFHATIVDLGTATVLVQTLVAIIALPQHEDFTDSLIQVIEELLKREWYTTGGEKEKGALFHQNLHVLLQEYLKQSKDPLKQMETICSEGLEQFLADSSKDRQSESFPTLNKNSLFVYYKAILSFLVSGTNKSLSIVGSASDDSRKRLLIWNTAIKILHTHVTILKNYYSRQMLSTCLKFARPFLEFFLRSAMPLMDTCFREHNQDVVMLLKSVQGSTRFLQNLCTHSKVKQDTTLTRYVPPLRKSLETLVYRVKAMLALNKCHNAFWMGILKNRDLHGEEILSQRSMEESEEEGNEEEEEVEDNDEQSDVEIEDAGEQASADDDKITDYSDSF
ncbi:Fanconi anemia group D2 protein-like isoform X1 [Scylla paramamosain]|uniref:Fanconi anemia group D2 protein-like isoform X1 n=1 Tax=Scylla paramamosain TaxID=85552 RepID=UPI003082C737